MCRSFKSITRDLRTSATFTRSLKQVPSLRHLLPVARALCTLLSVSWLRFRVHGKNQTIHVPLSHVALVCLLILHVLRRSTSANLKKSSLGDCQLSCQPMHCGSVPRSPEVSELCYTDFCDNETEMFLRILHTQIDDDANLQVLGQLSPRHVERHFLGYLFLMTNHATTQFPSLPQPKVHRLTFVRHMIHTKNHAATVLLMWRSALCNGDTLPQNQSGKQEDVGRHAEVHKCGRRHGAARRVWRAAPLLL